MDKNCFYWDDFAVSGEYRYVCKSSGHIEATINRIGHRNNPYYATNIKAGDNYISLGSAKKAVEEAVNEYFDSLIKKK